MKYRRLTNEELAELEEQFIRFLAANSITGPVWEDLKQADDPRVEQLIGQFSDLVFDKVIANVKYLEWRQARDFRTFHCGPDRLQMNGFMIEGATSLDLRQNLPPDQMLSMVQVSGAKLKLYSGEREYRHSRERDLFELMENGARISQDGAMYHTLEQLKQQQQQ